jgi:site-specific recombinase XerD
MSGTGSVPRASAAPPPRSTPNSTGPATHRTTSSHHSKGTRTELQGFFDLADLEVERVLASGRKGAVAAYRDANVFKTAYAWGLRANEVTHLQTVDFSRNRRAPQFGEFGVLQVRYGKAQRGSPPKRRSVLTVFDWSPDVLDTWIRTGLPWLAPAVSEIFPTANGLPVPKSNLHRRFRDYIDELAYPPGLDIHSLRRSLSHPPLRTLRLRPHLRPAAGRTRTRLDDLPIYGGFQRLPDQ